MRSMATLELTTTKRRSLKFLLQLQKIVVVEEMLWGIHKQVFLILGEEVEVSLVEIQTRSVGSDFKNLSCDRVGDSRSQRQRVLRTLRETAWSSDAKGDQGRK
eukprot:TRINITY_DN8679_c0_g1_i1.p1 TRINITY_DN8679_c0_g1~~TRINITY_DN8679_c0_g1_i1.p1  ORF type:complete len:103 (-),score=4.29 TRINITY_DN8679_c0_g1_i1:46-354(-)